MQKLTVVGIAFLSALSCSFRTERTEYGKANQPPVPATHASQQPVHPVPQSTEVAPVRNSCDAQLTPLQGLGEFSNMAYNNIIKRDPLLTKFANVLFDSDARKEGVVQYMLYRHPIIITGNTGKQAHHHRLIMLNPKMGDMIKNKTLKYAKDREIYKINLTNYQHLEISQYDNIRYVWWNPYVENFNDPKHFPQLQGEFSLHSTSLESGLALIISYFKLTFDRSPENLLRLYQKFKDPFYKKLSRDMYIKLKIGHTVDMLIQSYEFHKQKDLAGLLINLNAKYSQAKIFSPARHLAEENWSWYYSFWTRRTAEGNQDTVLRILREVQEHYQPHKK